MLPPSLRSLAPASLLCCAALLLNTGCAADPPSKDDDKGDRADDTDEDTDDARGESARGDGGTMTDARTRGDGSSMSDDDDDEAPADGDDGGGDDGGNDDDGDHNAACGFVPNEDGWVAKADNAAGVQGAVFTYASEGSTIMPLTDETTPFENAGDGRLCVKGSAAQVVDEMYGVYFGAGMGFDLCANGASDEPPNEKYALGACPFGQELVGLRFKLSGSTVPSELRVQFKETARDEATYVLAKSGANTVLFEDGKVVYDPMADPVDVSKIESVQFAIPTNADAPTKFDFCIEDVVLLTESGTCEDGGSPGSTKPDAGSDDEIDGGSDADVDAGDDEADAGDDEPGELTSCVRDDSTWSSSAQYGTRTFDQYVLRNNFWNQGVPGAGSQTVWGKSPSCWGLESSHTDTNPKGTVKSYPDMQRGWGIGAPGFPNANHGLNIRVSELAKAKIRWKMQAPTSGRTWALWDIYFHESENPGADRAPVNLMIQQRIVDSDGWMQQDSSSWEKVTIAGYTFRQKFETDTVSSTRTRIQLYVDETKGAVLGVDDMKLDLKAVIDHFVAEGKIKSTDYLTSIQAGWEVVSGGSYKTDAFWTAVQDEADGP